MSVFCLVTGLIAGMALLSRLVIVVVIAAAAAVCLFYTGIVTLVVRGLARRSDAPFRGGRAFFGAIGAAIGGGLVGGLLGQLTWDPSGYREDFVWQLVWISSAFAAWPGAMLTGAPQLIRTFRTRRITLVLLVVGAASAVVLVDRIRPRTNAELVALMEEPTPNGGSLGIWRQYASGELIRRGESARSAIPGLIRLIEGRFLTTKKSCYGEIQVLEFTGSGDDGSDELLGRVARLALDFQTRSQGLTALKSMTRAGRGGMGPRESLRRIVNQRPIMGTLDARIQREAAFVLVLIDPSEPMGETIQDYVREQLNRLSDVDQQSNAITRLHELGAASELALPSLWESLRRMRARSSAGRLNAPPRTSQSTSPLILVVNDACGRVQGIEYSGSHATNQRCAKRRLFAVSGQNWWKLKRRRHSIHQDRVFPQPVPRSHEL